MHYGLLKPEKDGPIFRSVIAKSIFDSFKVPYMSNEIVKGGPIVVFEYRNKLCLDMYIDMIRSDDIRFEFEQIKDVNSLEEAYQKIMKQYQTQ